MLTIPLNTRLTMTPFKIPIDKYEDTTDESNLTYFEKDNYSEYLKHLLSNIRQVNCSTTRQVDLSASKQALWISMNLKTKVKVELIADGCVDTIFQLLEMVLPKFSRLNKRPPWLDLMMTYPRNTFQLELLRMPLMYQIVILMLSLTIPHYSVKVKITCSQQHRTMILVQPYIMWLHAMIKN